MACVAAVNRNGVLDLGKYKRPPPHIPALTLAPLPLPHLCPVSPLLCRLVLSQKCFKNRYNTFTYLIKFLY